MTYNSYAKINIFLDVVSLYKNGFHGIKSIFLETCLADKIEYSVNKSGVCIVNDKSGIIPSVNLITKAYDLFYDKTGLKKIGIIFDVTKNIPAGGGLGGGSSNAASVLKILNKLSNYPLSIKKLESISAEIGSDIPYFITGKSKKVFGKGELLSKIKTTKIDLHTVLLFPNTGVSTPDAYRWIDEDKNYYRTYDANKKYNMLIEGLINNIPEKIIAGLFNKFENSVFKRIPELKKIKDDMLYSGLDAAIMSGSGSTMIGFSLSKGKLDKSVDILNEKGYKVRVISLNF